MVFVCVCVCVCVCLCVCMCVSRLTCQKRQSKNSVREVKSPCVTCTSASPRGGWAGEKTRSRHGWRGKQQQASCVAAIAADRRLALHLLQLTSRSKQLKQQNAQVLQLLQSTIDAARLVLLVMNVCSLHVAAPSINCL